MMMLRSDLKKEGGIWSFSFLLITVFIVLSQFAEPVIAASSSSSSATLPRRVVIHKHTERLKKSPTPSVSLALRRREWKPFPAALNSSRNARQVPEIPALYSAPQIQNPEIPALYSAPQVNSDVEQQHDEDIQNEVDSQGRATTEITIGDDEEEEDETSSEDYQYGVPTEKNLMSDDPSQNEQESPNDYPTDSPLPQATYLPPVSKTNDVEFDDDQQSNADDDTTEDSAGGYNDSNNGNNEPSSQYGPPNNNGNGQPSSQYGSPSNINNGNNQPSPEYGPPRNNNNNNGNNEPSAQYGPPQANSRKNGNGNGNGAKKRKMQSSSSTSPNTASRTNNSNSNNNRRPSDQQQIENSLQPMTRHQQGNPTNDPKPGYLPPVYQPPTSAPSQQQQEGTPHQNQRQQQEEEIQQGKQQETYSNSYGSNHVDDYEQQPPNSNYHTLPQNQQQESAPSQQQQHPLQDLSQEVRSPSQSQGQNFGNNQHQHQPNSFYGPPGGVNHFHQSQNQRQPSNGNGEEDELEGLNEKIVDAELLERVQQIIEDHERQQKVLLDKIQKDNEKALFTSPGASGISSPFTGNELSSGNNNNDRNNGFSPRPFYGPPSLNSNGYSKPNFAQKPDPAYLPPASSSRQNPTAGGYTNSQQSDNHRGEKQRDSSSSPSSSTTNLSPNVQVQKAVLSRHFTETEPGPAPAYSNSNNNNRKNKDDNINRQQTGYGNNQLNSVAGPGEEYLPPSPPSSSSSPAQSQQQQNRNSGYSNSFQSGDGAREFQQQQPQQDFSVKLGTGITVADNTGSKSTSGGSPIPYSSASITYGPPALSPTISQDSRDSHARQNGGSSPPVAVERFPSQSRQYQAPSQQQNFASSGFWSRSNPASPAGLPQPRYGPPGLGNDNKNNGDVAPYQNGPTDNVVVNSKYGSGDSNYNQRSYPAQQPQSSSSPQQYLPPTTLAPSSNSNNDNRVMMIAVPRPVYGVPLAPVITLDSDNNLHHFNENNNNPSYSPEAGKFATSFPVSTGTSTAGPTSNYYLPPEPSKLSSPSTQVGLGQFHQLSSPNSQQQAQSPGNTPSTNANHYDEPSSYGGFVPANNNPTSSSSAYLMFQGHDGNSNNHIYNINHNGYDDTSSGSSSRSIVIFAQQHPLEHIHVGSAGSSSSSSVNPSEPDYRHHDDHASSSIIIPGISNTFSLPIYDYSPSHQNLHNDELLGAAATPVGLSFEQLLQQQQLPPNIQALTLPSADFSENIQPIFYDGGATRRQDNFRVSRRALSRKASVSPASSRKSSISNANPKLSSTTQQTTTTRRNSNKNNYNGNSQNGRQRRNRNNTNN